MIYGVLTSLSNLEAKFNISEYVEIGLWKFKKLVAFKKAGFWEKERSSSFVDVAGFNNRSIATSSFTWLCFEKKIASWATELLGCWAAHHLEQWSLLGAACSTLGQLQVSGNDSPFVIVSGSVSCQLQDFSSQVLQHSCKVDWGTSSNSLSVVSFADASVDSSNGELQTSSAWSCLWGFSSNFAALWFSSFARQCLLVWSSLTIVFWFDEMIDFRSLFAS